MRIRAALSTLLAVLLYSNVVLAQNWSFDARAVALGGVGGSGNLASKMIDEQRLYTSIVLPFGLFQVFSDLNVFNPDSRDFDPIRAIEYAASPIHFVLNRRSGNSGQTAFVSDIRNATLSRDLSRYAGFVPANDLLAEGLASPNWGYTFKVKKEARGGFQGIYVGAGPYLSMRTVGTIDPRFTNVLATGVNLPNAEFPFTNTDEGQFALAVTGGYRGRFGWPAGTGKGTDREGLYLAANYNFLRGFQYENFDMTIRLNTDNSGLLFSKPGTTPVAITWREATEGTGFAIDVGVGAVIDHWEVGFGARGLGNRIDWTGVLQTRYVLDNLLSGNSDFRETSTVLIGDTRVELPVDYRGYLGYVTDKWSGLAEIGHGFGGNSFHGGYERRVGRVELRGGARYTTKIWNPTGGVGFDFTEHFSMDVAAYGTNANIERKRQVAIAVSLRLNHLQ